MPCDLMILEVVGSGGCLGWDGNTADKVGDDDMSCADAGDRRCEGVWTT